MKKSQCLLWVALLMCLRVMNGFAASDNNGKDMLPVGTIVFEASKGAFSKMKTYSSTLSSSKQTLIGYVGEEQYEYSFTSNGGQYTTFLKLKSSSGNLTSPSFEAFSGGYVVTITYGCSNDNYPSLSSGTTKVTGTKLGNINTGTGATISLTVPDGSPFSFKTNGAIVTISKITVEPTAILQTPTLNFKSKSVVRNLDVTKPSAPKLELDAAASDLLDNPDNLEVSYSISPVAGTTQQGNIFTITKEGEYKLAVKFAGNDTYCAASDELALTVTDPRPTDNTFKFAEPAVYEVYLGENGNEFDAAEKLQNPNGLAVTYTVNTNNAAIDDYGKVHFTAKGTYTITANGAANTAYKAAMATCELVVKAGESENRTVEFVAGEDRGKTTLNNSPDAMFKSPVTISSTNAAFAAQGSNVYTYRMYTQSKTTVSTRMGNITKIEFSGKGNSSNNSLKNLYTEDKNYKAQNDNYGVWTGSAKDVTLSASTTAHANKIVITVKDIPESKSYAFDEKSQTNSSQFENNDNANVKINRIIEADNAWWTLCVPFDLNEFEIAQYFGDNTKLCTFDSMEGSVMNFAKATAIEAGKPYLIKPSKTFDGTSTTLEGVVLKAGKPQSLGAEGYAMSGIYDMTALADDGTALFLSKNNTFKRPNESNCTMNGFRAYFSVPTNSDSGKPMSLSAANFDGIETSLVRINGAPLNTDPRIFNLQGQCLGTSPDNLPRGVYIRRGKKIVIR